MPSQSTLLVLYVFFRISIKVTRRHESESKCSVLLTLQSSLVIASLSGSIIRPCGSPGRGDMICLITSFHVSGYFLNCPATIYQPNRRNNGADFQACCCDNTAYHLMPRMNGDDVNFVKYSGQLPVRPACCAFIKSGAGIKSQLMFKSHPTTIQDRTCVGAFVLDLAHTL